MLPRGVVPPSPTGTDSEAVGRIGEILLLTASGFVGPRAISIVLTYDDAVIRVALVAYAARFALDTIPRRHLLGWSRRNAYVGVRLAGPGFGEATELTG